MKNKKLLIGLLMLTGISVVKAQDKKDTTNLSAPSGFVAINFGISSPLGTYSSTGYALSGYDYNISEGACIKHSNFGVAFKFDDFGNAFDVTSYTNNTTNFPNFQWQSGSGGSYSGTTVLVGLYGTFPYHHFTADYRILGGLMLVQCPTIDATEEDYYGNTIEHIYSSDNSDAFAFDIGVGIRWNVSKRICLRLDYDYMSASPTFTTTQSKYENGALYNTTNYTFSQSISISSATFGIGWVLR